MNPTRFKDTLLLALLALLHRRSPLELQRTLKRCGFQPGDVTFRTTKSGRTWTEIHRWPWDER